MIWSPRHYISADIGTNLVMIVIITRMLHILLSVSYESTWNNGIKRLNSKKYFTRTSPNCFPWHGTTVISPTQSVHKHVTWRPNRCSMHSYPSSPTLNALLFAAISIIQCFFKFAHFQFRYVRNFDAITQKSVMYTESVFKQNLHYTVYHNHNLISI